MVNKNVLSCLLKDGKEVNAVMLVGRLLHARATVTRNDLSAMVLSQVCVTIRNECSSACSQCLLQVICVEMTLMSVCYIRIDVATERRAGIPMAHMNVSVAVVTGAVSVKSILTTAFQVCFIAFHRF